MVTMSVWKDEAKNLAQQFGLNMDGDSKTVILPVKFVYRSINGYPKIVVDIQIPDELESNDYKVRER